jgi:hypothetical protein
MLRAIKLFFGYQFANTKINRIDRESAYNEILENINSDIEESEGAMLSWKYWGLKTNDYVGEQILNQIDLSDILVFDLSEPNVNVFLELGYAIALSRQKDKQVILVLHEEVNVKEIGSDLSGRYVLKVNSNNIIPKLGKKIRDAVREYINSSKTSLLQDFWGVSKSNRFHIICPEIPVAFRTKFASSEDTNYLRYSKFADIDSLVYVKVHLKAIDHNSTITDFTSGEYYQSIEECQVVIGGPAWNRISKEYQKILPTKFEDGGDGNDDPLVIRDGGERTIYLPKQENGSLIFDMSLFARLRHGLKERVYLLSGCRTLGVMGASKAFLAEDSAPDNIKFISKLVGDSDFVVVFKTKPFYGTVSTINLNEDSIEVLFVLDESTSKFERVI